MKGQSPQVAEAQERKGEGQREPFLEEGETDLMRVGRLPTKLAHSSSSQISLAGWPCTVGTPGLPGSLRTILVSF